MRLPGFTADQLLREQMATYTFPETRTTSALAGAVVPQFFHCWGDYCCNEFGYCIYKGHVLM